MLPSASSFFKKVCLLALVLAESIFFVSPALAARETILHNFTGNSAGAYPFSNLIFDPLGNLYGESNGYGSFEGNVYELSPDGAGGWNYTEIYEFGFDGLGAFPTGPLTMDDKGNLYGVTLLGGTNNTGTVYVVHVLNAAFDFPVEIAVTIDSKHGIWHSTIMPQAAPLNLSTIASEASSVLASAYACSF
jgi:uncharacterized repeat protein (TIGR03803 family)